MELFENLYENLRMLVWGMVRPQVPTKDELGVGHTRTRGASDIPGHQSPRIMFGKGGHGTRDRTLDLGSPSKTRPRVGLLHWGLGTKVSHGGTPQSIRVRTVR